jgi:hypothetical protein
VGGKAAADECDLTASQPLRPDRVLALIFGHRESQDPGVKVDGGIEVGRKDLTPQRHLYPGIVAQPAEGEGSSRSGLAGAKIAVSTGDRNGGK